MAEGGNQSEGQESSAESAHLADMHISTYEEMKAENVAESQRGAMGWAEAGVKDERGQIRHRATVPSSRSWQSRQASYRKGQDWKRTVARARQSIVYSSTSHPREPYGKGEQQRFWGKITWGLFRLLGLD